MSKITYVYNQKTCQYERARLSIREAVVYVIGLGAMSFVFFVGLIFLYNYFVESDAEKALRAENKAIEQYKPILEQKLAVIQSTLTELDKKDQTLYTQLFNAPPPTDTKRSSLFPKNKVLLANTSEFRAFLDNLETKSKTLASKTAASNGTTDHFMNNDALGLLEASPSLSPIQGLTAEQLTSGFGDRVNPFHKGTYHHTGIDVTFPRGTVVVAGGTGTVTSVKRSALQAGYGNAIEIDHGHGFVTRYAHLEEITVRVGQKIEKGMQIGTVGNSGGSIAPHLHYEILIKGQPVNPVLYMIEGFTPAQYSVMLQKSKQQNQSLD
jgi:murein DD-endopeptidase MepM/ murein hydrolase activator NlpD